VQIHNRGVEGASVYRLSDPQGSEAAASDFPTAEAKKPAHHRRESKAKARA